jgi:hypothetical protein
MKVHLIYDDTIIECKKKKRINVMSDLSNLHLSFIYIIYMKDSFKINLYLKYYKHY